LDIKLEKNLQQHNKDLLGKAGAAVEMQRRLTGIAGLL
jgi:hypothetical protein